MEWRAEVTQAGVLPTPLHCGWPQQSWVGVCAGDRFPLAMPPFFRAMAAVRSNPPPGGGGWVGAAGWAGGCRAEWGEGNGVAAHLAAGSFLALMAAGHLQMRVWLRETRRFFQVLSISVCSCLSTLLEFQLSIRVCLWMITSRLACNFWNQKDTNFSFIDL